MQQFLKERKLPDPLPSSWIHFYDGNSAEVTLSDEPHATDNKLLSLVNNPEQNVIRNRMKYHDAPEAKYSACIYKQLR